VHRPSQDESPPVRGLVDDPAALCAAAGGGEPAALDRLYACVYGELRRLAHRVRAGRAGATLSTTVLVHEAYIKLRPTGNAEWKERAHFFAVAARAMRQVLVDAARRRAADKRGGGVAVVTLGDEVAQAARPDDLLALDEALDRLGALDARQLQVVEFRFFAGLTAAETAAQLGVSVTTVEREWRAARAWLSRELRRR